VSVVLDASALIALLDADDAHHSTVLDALDDLAGDELLMHPLTVAECFVVPVAAGREQDLVDALERLRITVDPGTPGDAEGPLRLARLRVATGLRMPDCCPIELADRHGSMLVTFHDRQRDRAARLGIAVAPLSDV